MMRLAQAGHHSKSHAHLYYTDVGICTLMPKRKVRRILNTSFAMSSSSADSEP